MLVNSKGLSAATKTRGCNGFIDSGIAAVNDNTPCSSTQTNTRGKEEKDSDLQTLQQKLVCANVENGRAVDSLMESPHNSRERPLHPTNGLPSIFPCVRLVFRHADQYPDLTRGTRIDTEEQRKKLVCWLKDQSYGLHKM